MKRTLSLEFCCDWKYCRNSRSPVTRVRDVHKVPTDGVAAQYNVDAAGGEPLTCAALTTLTVGGIIVDKSLAYPCFQ